MVRFMGFVNNLGIHFYAKLFVYSSTRQRRTLGFQCGLYTLAALVGEYMPCYTLDFCTQTAAEFIDPRA